MLTISEAFKESLRDDVDKISVEDNGTNELFFKKRTGNIIVTRMTGLYVATYYKAFVSDKTCKVAQGSGVFDVMARHKNKDTAVRIVKDKLVECILNGITLVGSTDQPVFIDGKHYRTEHNTLKDFIYVGDDKYEVIFENNSRLQSSHYGGNVKISFGVDGQVIMTEYPNSDSVLFFGGCTVLIMKSAKKVED